MIVFANQEELSTIHPKRSNQKERFVFVVQLKDGRYAVGSGTNPAKRIAALNSGLNQSLPKSLQVHRIVGIKPVNADRNEVIVFGKFEARYGQGKVLAV